MYIFSKLHLFEGNGKTQIIACVGTIASNQLIVILSTTYASWGELVGPCPTHGIASGISGDLRGRFVTH